MKTLIKYILVLSFFIFIGFSVWHLSEKVTQKKEISERLKFLPKLNVYHLDSTHYNQDALPNKPIVIIYFNSECNYCQREIKSIEEDITSFGQSNVLLISSESIKTISLFQNQYDFINHPQVRFLKINEDMIYPTFGAVSVPHLFIYGKNGQLLKEYKGETKIEAIVKHIKP